MVYRNLIDTTLTVVENRVKERLEEIRVCVGGMADNGEISQEACEKIDQELQHLLEDL